MNIQVNKNKFKIILGENHYNSSRDNINNIIRYLKPDIVLHELLYDDVISTTAQATNTVKHCGDNNKCEIGLNNDIYELATQFPCKWYGVDFPHQSNVENIHALRERHFFNEIERLGRADKVIVVLGSDHVSNMQRNGWIDKLHDEWNIFIIPEEMPMTNNTLTAFIESLRNESNNRLVDTILSGYTLCMETAEWDGTHHIMHTLITNNDVEDKVPFSKLDKWKKFTNVNASDNKRMLDYWQSLPSVYDT